MLSLSLFASCAIAGMDAGHHSRSRSDNLELHPSPTFRELFEQDQAASRLLEPNSTFDGNKRSSTHHVNDTSFDLADKVTPVGNKSPHYRYESVDTTDKSASENAAHVLWKGIPAYALTWELLGILILVLFLILGAFVVSLRGQTESEWSKRIIQATRIAPSIWPILFSGVLGNAVRRFANWRVERGIRLLVRATILPEQASDVD